MRTIEFDTNIKNGIIRVPFPLAPDIAGKTAPAKVILVLQGASQPAFNKLSLLKAFENAWKTTVFKKITNSIVWQKKLRDEWK